MLQTGILFHVRVAIGYVIRSTVHVDFFFQLSQIIKILPGEVHIFTTVFLQLTLLKRSIYHHFMIDTQSLIYDK